MNHPRHTALGTFGPLLLAGLGFAFREAGRPAAAAPLPPGHAVALPTPNLLPFRPSKDVLELVAERSTARFLVRGAIGELAAKCPSLRGSLQLDPEPQRCQLELRLDLASLVGLDGAPVPSDALRQLLGVHRSGEVVFRGTLAHTLTTPVPGLVQLVFDGRLALGGHVVRQTLGLWRAALPGQAQRFLGHGTVAASDYGLPRRSFLGFGGAEHQVTLGLDLAFVRRSGG